MTKETQPEGFEMPVMQGKKMMLIINPISGTTGKAGLDRKAVKCLSPLGVDVDVRYTEYAGHASELAAEAARKGYAGVIAAGGDGTINEVASSLCNTGVPLGIVPAGSGNGLARHVGIPIDFDLALKVVAQQFPLDVDYGTVNGKPFFCTTGVGFDAAVSHRFATQGKRGLMMYIKSMIETYRNYESETYTLSANGHVLTQKAFVVAVANASQYGNNAYIAPNASIRDGLLDVMIIHSGDILSTARVGMDMMSGYLDKNMNITTFRTPSVVIYRSAEGPAHMDGEPMILGDILDIRCHKGALKMFVPKDHSTFCPVITPVKSTLSGLGLGLRHLFSHKG
ncbi:MAG: diacylglycerol kinase family lipid kinase [Bacteroidales bacterium]|nr:diacylglycerol kinase family lipid kinase [Bacteroidales bacterium]